MIKITQRVYYGVQREVGDSPALSAADESNLVAGGYAEYVRPAEVTHVEVPSSIPVVIPAPVQSIPAPDAQPVSFACPDGCNKGRAFASAAALAAHRRAKHA